mmetsp:Transcript_18014/g.42904  ORF Transcript_18014/g.42904 Transcript_18014/m.42904 type:complete len:234 (+) Transcript_18014:1367-2068(+)
MLWKLGWSPAAKAMCGSSERLLVAVTATMVRSGRPASRRLRRMRPSRSVSACIAFRKPSQSSRRWTSSITILLSVGERASAASSLGDCVNFSGVEKQRRKCGSCRRAYSSEPAATSCSACASSPAPSAQLCSSGWWEMPSWTVQRTPSALPPHALNMWRAAAACWRSAARSGPTNRVSSARASEGRMTPSVLPRPVGAISIVSTQDTPTACATSRCSAYNFAPFGNAQRPASS